MIANVWTLTRTHAHTHSCTCMHADTCTHGVQNVVFYHRTKQLIQTLGIRLDATRSRNACHYDPLDTNTLSDFLFGDGAQMYQLDHASRCLAQTVIASHIVNFGFQSAYALNIKMLYAEGDEVSQLRRSCSDEAIASLVRMTRKIHIGTEVKNLVLRGIVGDTKFIWSVMGTAVTKDWSRPIGSNPFRREQYCFVDDDGNCLAWAPVVFTTDFKRKIIQLYRGLNGLQQEQFSSMIRKELGLKIEDLQLFEHIGWDKAAVGPLHIVGTATKNFVNDLVLIFTVAGVMVHA